MANAVERVSAQSLYRRFFAARRSFSEKETDFFVNVDFLNHVALVAVVNEGGAAVIIGGGRYVLVQPGMAEVAMRHLATIARDAGIEQFVAEVLPENAPMLKLFEKCGCRMSTKRDGHVVHVTLGLN
jgi:RimJ/RimL family protein N-acetyltransferase